MTREEALAQNANAIALFNALASGNNNTEALVDEAYTNLLGLEGDFSNAADRKAFWIDQFDSGNVTAENFAEEFLFLAENEPGQLTEAEQVYNTASVPTVAEASNGVAAQLEAEGRSIQDLTPEEIVEFAQSIRESASAAGQAAAEAARGNGGEEDTGQDEDGQDDSDSVPNIPPISYGNDSSGDETTTPTFTLTSDADDLVGTANDETFTAGLTAAGTQTLQTFDRIDGGEGTDTLRASLDADGDFGRTVGGEGNFATSVTNIENLHFHTLDTDTVNFDNYAGAEQVWADRMLANLSVTGLANIVTLGAIRGEGNTFDVEYVDGAIDAALDNDDRVTQSVVLQNADVTLNIDEDTNAFANTAGMVATLNVALTGDNAVVLTGDINDVIDTIATTGEGSIDLDVTAQVANIDWDVTLGAGDDRLAIDGTQLNADDSIDMGEGDDVLALTGLNIESNLNTLDLSGVSNVEGLEFIDTAVVSSGGTDTLSLESFDNVTFGDTLDSSTSVGTLVMDTDATALEANFESDVGAGTGVNLTVSEEVESLTLNAESSAVTLADLTNTAAADSSTESLSSLTLADTTNVNAPGFTAGDASTFDVTLADLNGLTSLNLEGIAGTDSADSGYASTIIVNASDANFGGPVTISIADGNYTYTNGANDKREIFQFAGENIGTITIDDATDNFAVTSADNGDKLDFSQFANVSSIDDLAITGGADAAESDFVVSAAGDQFEGSITLIGTKDIEQSVLEANGFIF